MENTDPFIVHIASKYGIDYHIVEQFHKKYGYSLITFHEKLDEYLIDSNKVTEELFNEAQDRFGGTLKMLGDNEPDPDIIKKNEMIVRYMGGLYSTKSGYWGIGGAKHGEGKLSGFVFAREHYSPSQLKYHASYDWIMPVIHKISTDRGGLLPDVFVLIGLNSSISDIYDTVCEYLEKRFGC